MEMKYVGLMLAAVALSSIPARLALLSVMLSTRVLLCRTNAEFDYFLFVQEWPQTLCEVRRSMWACSTCSNIMRLIQ